MAEETPLPGWLRGMAAEDWAFIRRFLLASGSLKEVAAEYGVSYPTVRARLDRLIAKIAQHEEHPEDDAFERTLRDAFIDGRIDAALLAGLLSAYRRERDHGAE